MAQPALPPPITDRRVEERSGPIPRGTEWEALVDTGQPVLIRGAALDWPLVQAGLQAPRAAADYLLSGHSGDPVVVYRGAPEIGGRFFYTPEVDGFNFTGTREALPEVLDELLALPGEPTDPAIYIGSTDLGLFFPGIASATSFDLGAIHSMLTEHPGLGSVWIGNRTTASCHYDYSHNIAVCAVGKRRFTLFPPDQIANLYPGPLEPTPGGQVVSLVDFAAPDLDKFPRFANALGSALVADMEEGDVLIYPAMWWHHVEALAGFNVLVNFWWNRVPTLIDSPQLTLLHALLSLRDRPADEKAAWKAVFDHYVFGHADLAREQIPAPAQGPLAPIDETLARRLRAQITRKLQR